MKRTLGFPFLMCLIIGSLLNSVSIAIALPMDHGAYKRAPDPYGASHLHPSMPDTAKLKMASYNIRYDAKADYKSGNGWNDRKRAIAKLIQKYRFEIIGTQEGNFDQMDDLMKLLPGYTYIGYPYGGANGRNHTASIVYKVSEFELLDQGQFWYSETPKVKSIGWDATDQRICTWAKMKHKPSGLKFYFFSSHFYWRYVTARQHSGQVLVNQIKWIATEDLPVISTGDLNSKPTTTQIADISAFLKDAYKISETPPKGPVGTNYHGGIFKGQPDGRIDYVFVNDKVKVLSYAVLNDTYGDHRHPSDHAPITCDIVLKK